MKLIIIEEVFYEVVNCSEAVELSDKIFYVIRITRRSIWIIDGDDGQPKKTLCGSFNPRSLIKSVGKLFMSICLKEVISAAVKYFIFGHTSI